MFRRALLVGLMLGSAGAILTGCLQVTTLIVTPVSAIIEGGESVAFTATNHLGNPVPVIWSVTAGPGTITQDGVYTAPATVTEVTNATVTATLVSNPNITASATVTIKPPITAGLVDGLGDAWVWPPGYYDIESIKTSRTSTTLTVTITFDPATPPSIPPAGTTCTVADGLYCGWIDFDVDQSILTGIPSFNAICPCYAVSALGADFSVDLIYRNAAGNYDIIETTGFTDVGDAVPTVVGNVLTLTIPLTDLGGDDGVTNMSSVQFISQAPATIDLTDCIPDEDSGLVTGEGITIDSNPYLDYLWDKYGITVQTPSLTQTRSFELGG